MPRVLTVCAAFILACAASAAEVQIYTEEAPPNNFTKDGKITGSATEIVQAMMAKGGIQAKIEVVPWARGIKEATEKPNIGLYSTTRNAKREDLFHWVGPVARKRVVLYGLKGIAAKVKTIDDAKKVKAIGTYKDDAKGMKLKELGFANLEEVPKDDMNPKKLSAGRIDLWVTGESEGPITAKANGVEPDQLEVAVVVSTTELYLVFAKATDPAFVKPWQDAYAAIVADGTVAGIVKKWNVAW